MQTGMPIGRETVSDPVSAPFWCDAHNHLQDPRFHRNRADIVKQCRAVGIHRMIVNGTGPWDWPDVTALTATYPEVGAAYGCHPWWLNRVQPGWKETLQALLRADSRASVGETGLDLWILDAIKQGRRPHHPIAPDPAPLEDQVAVLQTHLQLASEWNRAITIHCLRAWGPLIEVLRHGPVPGKGFLLHSYSGPREMVDSFVRLGGYFSFSGYFLHEHKQRVRQVFRSIPPDRILVETDAPDQIPPESHRPFPIETDTPNQPVNHPANLPTLSKALALDLGMDWEAWQIRTTATFLQLFGR